MKKYYCADTYCIGKVENKGDLCEECAQERETGVEPNTPKTPVDNVIGAYFAKIKLEVITPDDVEQAEPKRNSRTKQAEIDGLLDELNVLKTVVDICGTDEDYAVRIADVKAKLKEATA